MPAIQDLLQRLGFVKLRRYGLELTTDGRIVSSRPVLDDGTGSRVVGWQDGDVAIWKLSRFAEGSTDGAPQPEKPVARAPRSEPAAKEAAAPAADAMAAFAAAAAAARAVAVAAEPVIPAASVTAERAPSQPSAAVIPAEVAAEPAVDEDDWEWTIALARARVAVEEAEAAVPPEPPISRRAPANHVVARPLIKEPVPAPPPAELRPEPTTGEYAEYRVSSSRSAIEIPRVTQSPATTAPPATTVSTKTAPLPTIAPSPIAARTSAPPSTVIPVPPLPVADAALCSRLEPVVRSSQSQSQSATGRFAKGTAPLDPPAPHAPAMLVEDTVPNLAIGDRTTPGIAPAQRAGAAASEPPTSSTVGDRTTPGIALPPTGRTRELPSIKRRTAPR